MPSLVNPPSEDELVFNMVWTGRVFDHLRLFTESLLEWGGARLRFVANACPRDQLDHMERFAADHPGRVVEVLDVSPVEMVRHGDALDAVYRSRDDGEFFCFIDPDIFASGPYLGPFCAALEAVDVVTSGREVWSDHNIRPADQIGVNGEYFFDQDGFTFGSPHLALYRRAALDDTIDRWGVGFSSAGNDISEAARTGLRQAGRDYWIFDTAKIVNILLQADGHSLQHLENPQLLHIGGVSHYLAPPEPVADADGLVRRAWGHEPDWGKWDGMAARFQVAAYTASVLQALLDGRPAPTPPDSDPAMLERLALVRSALTELVERHGVSDGSLDRRT